MIKVKEKKLNLFLLITLIVGTIIGGGIFNSPTDLILKANPLASLIAWLIGGFGILMLVLVFYKLAIIKPEMNGGIYTYAREGFGNYVGFNSFWGYWMGAVFGNIAFISLFFKTLNSMLGTHQLSPLWCFIGGSIILWGYTAITWFGVREASILNAVITILKILPLVLVVIVGIFDFQPHIFDVPDWSSILAVNHQQVSLGEQISGAMSTIVWCFVGIEAAVSMSRRAKQAKDVGKATVISFVIVLVLYISISILPMGILPAKELSQASVPLAAALNHTALGTIGSLIIKVGLLISLLGALLSWFMIGPEIAYVTSYDKDMPRPFRLVNKHNVPGFALIVYTLIMQICLLVLLLPQLQTAYTIAYTLAATMTLVAYLLSALYGLKLAFNEKLGLGFKVIAFLASLYAIYMLIASGLEYVFASAIIFALGIPLFASAPNKMTKKEKGLAVIIALAGVVALILIVNGKISF
ncbi:amino acid permease [Lactobacillus sp. 0.1XD8-4]|uniref:amino acid permease n=1 Tax=uncultured Limosilactobacillus sp. TaxID=2837629 RepID=UPI00351CE31F|nr:amino acid permease [Lactobacillus sp. 0.1XD8-4]